MKSLFTLKSFEDNKTHVIDCPFIKMYKLLNMRESEFWTVMINDFDADFLKISMPGHNYIMFRNLKNAEQALDWINSQVTLLKLSGFVPVIDEPIYSNFEDDY